MNRSYLQFSRGDSGPRGGSMGGGRMGGGNMRGGDMRGANWNAPPSRDYQTDQMVNGIVKALMGGGPYSQPMHGARGGAMNYGMSRGASPFRGARGGARGGATSRGGTPMRGARGAPQVGDKRSFSRGAPSSNRGAKKVSPQTKPSEKKPAKRIKLQDIEIPDEDIVLSEELIENVNKLRERTSDEIEMNAVDEDIKKLQVFSFNGTVWYNCMTCSRKRFNAETAYIEHMNCKAHAVKVVEARTEKKYDEVRNILDIDLTSDNWLEESELAKKLLKRQALLKMRIAKAREIEEQEKYNQDPSNFHRFHMDVKKVVTKKNDEVITTSIIESSIATKDYKGEMGHGSEFIRAVAGFHCTLCNTNIREAKGVLAHIETMLHKKNYSAHIAKDVEYQNKRNIKNAELLETLTEHEGKGVVLLESEDTEHSQFLPQLDSILIRIPSLMEGVGEEKKDKEDEADNDAKADDEGTKKDEGEEAQMDKGDEEAQMDKGDEEAQMDKGDEEAQMDKGDEEAQMDKGDEEDQLDKGAETVGSEATETE